MKLAEEEFNYLDEAKKLSLIPDNVENISNIYIERINEPEKEKLEHEVLKGSVLLKKNSVFTKHL